MDFNFEIIARTQMTRQSVSCRNLEGTYLYFMIPAPNEIEVEYVHIKILRIGGLKFRLQFVQRKVFWRTVRILDSLSKNLVPNFVLLAFFRIWWFPAVMI